MMNHIISMISARSKYKNGVLIEANDLNTEMRYQNIIRDLENGVVNQDKINEFFTLITGTKSNATQPLTIIEKCSNVAPLYAKILVNNFTKNILPCIDDYKGVNKEIEKYEGLDAEKKASIKEAVETLEVADRIYTNHLTLSKRFNIDKISESFIKTKNYDRFVDKLYSLIETYDIKEYQKMNLVIEELSYLLQKNGVNYEPLKLYESVINYCVNNTDESMENITRVVSESKLIDGSDIEKLIAFLKKQDSRKDLTHGWWLKYIDRGEQKLPESLKEVFASTPDYNLSIGICEFIDNIDQFTKNNKFHNEFKVYVEELTDDLVERDCPSEQLKDIRNEVNNKINSSKDLEESTINVFKPLIETINDEIALKYTASNIKNIEEANKYSEPVSIHEFGLQYNDLIKTIKKFNDFLKRKEKNGQYSKLKDKFKDFGTDELTSALYGESSMIDNIGSDNRADIIVAKISLDESDNIEELSDDVTAFLSDFNNESCIEGNDKNIAYYTMVEGQIDIHIKNNTILKEGEQLPVSENTIEEEYDSTIDDLVNEAMSLRYKPVLEYLHNINECTDFTYEHFHTVLEELSYMGVSKEDVQEFATIYSDYRFNHNMKDRDDIIKEDVIQWINAHNTDIEVSLEAYKLLVETFKDAGMTDLLSESTLEDRMKSRGFYSDEDRLADIARNKKEDEEDDDDEKPKKKRNRFDIDNEEEDDEEIDRKVDKTVDTNKPKPIESTKTGSKLVTIKLALKGLAAKAKEFNNKHKMAVNHFDSMTRNFIKKMKDAASNERREQIIRGSVIPSFSRIIKMGIVLSGMGALVTAGVMPVIIPVITALGTFAMDKQLMKKERLLLLDEIDTELDVIDKEINLAEQNNQLNKYRALLRYKKTLQRQYQRIRYNVRIGKDIDPGVGMQLKAGE